MQSTLTGDGSNHGIEAYRVRKNPSLLCVAIAAPWLTCAPLQLDAPMTPEPPPVVTPLDTPVTYSCELTVPANGSVSRDTRSTDNPFTGHSADLSSPLPTQFQWKSNGCCGKVIYDFYLSKDSSARRTSPLAVRLSNTGLPVYNLEIATRYFWQVLLRVDNGTICTTGVFSFTTPDLWPRMIRIEGTTNVRDIGGLKTPDGRTVRQGMYYRSAEFNQNHIITPTGIQRILDLGIVFEIDLRNDGESPMAALPSSVRYFRPANPTGIMSPYLYGLQNNPDQYRDVFKELAEPENYPCICHCRAGADRTGTVTALLEALLGCSYEQIARDFQWTSLSVYGIRDTTWQEWKDMIGEIRRRAGDSTLFSGAVNYLLSIGVTPEECAAIRSILLEPVSNAKKPITAAAILDIGPVCQHYHRNTPKRRESIPRSL
jgi:hypothetical protein